MSTYTADQIRAVLDQHQRWLRGEADGARANLSRANLYGANLSGAKNVPEHWIARAQIVPQDGAFLVFKKLRGGIVGALEIPEGAQRVGGCVGRKCRASEALVLGFLAGKNEPAPDVEVAYSTHDRQFAYRVGETVTPKEAFDPNPLVECASGIHFFLSYEEAEEYA